MGKWLKVIGVTGITRLIPPVITGRGPPCTMFVFVGELFGEQNQIHRNYLGQFPAEIWTSGFFKKVDFPSFLETLVDE